MGAPNRMGSLTPNSEGMKAILPISRWALDLENRNQITTPMVTPRPVKPPKPDIGPGVKIWVATPPACTAAMFSAKNCVAMGITIGESTDGWMPKKKIKQRSMW